jgi:glycosyltransferase involved in cell wall biosynthesis
VHVWLITVGEPLPGLSEGSRLWRTGLVAEELVRRGHSVTWWTSRVDHFHKRRFPASSAVFHAYAGLTVRFLDGCLYRRNVSFARLLNHWQVGRDFHARSASAPAPQVILCSFPTIELAGAAARYARDRKIPIVMDVRDLWPDVFLLPAPERLRGALRVLLRPYFATSQRALAGAAALIAVSQQYLEWGLARAGRTQRSTDGVFPLAYSLAPANEASQGARTELLRRFGVRPDSTVCMFAGTFGRTYDLGPVLACAAQFASEGNRGFHFLICGEGERGDEWRRSAAGLPNVSFTGWLAQDEMRAALGAADIGLAAYAPDAPQGMPNKVIEYLAAGLAVVSSLAGETAQLLSAEKCGRTYAAGSAASLREALQGLRGADARRALAESARRVFAARFRAEAVYPRLAEYLERTAGMLES